MPPANIHRLDSPLFLKDPSKNFINVLFGKLDFDLVWVMAVFMVAFDVWKTTPIEAGVSFYCYYKLVLYWP